VPFFLDLFLFQKPKRTYYWLSIVFFLLSIGSKEAAVTLPATAFILFLLRAESWHDFVAGWKCFLYTLPFWVLSAAYIAIRYVHWKTVPDAIALYTNFSFKTIIYNYGNWLFALLYPGDLYKARLLLEVHPRLFTSVAIAISAALCVLLWILIDRKKVLQFRHYKFAFSGIALFIITLTPTMAGKPFRWYLYLPAAGLGFFLIFFYSVLKQNRIVAGSIFFGITLCVMSIGLLQRTRGWQEQHMASTSFFTAFTQSEAMEHDDVILLNVPLGYKNAFVLPHLTIACAMRLLYNKDIHVDILTYIHLSDSTAVTVQKNLATTTFSLQPDHYQFFYFRTFDLHLAKHSAVTKPVLLAKRKLPTGESYTRQGCTVTIGQTGKAGVARSFSVDVTNATRPVFYYDGKHIRRLQSGQQATNRQ